MLSHICYFTYRYTIISVNCSATTLVTVLLIGVIFFDSHNSTSKNVSGNFKEIPPVNTIYQKATFTIIFIHYLLTLSFLIPNLVINWQSYNSTRCRLWQEVRWSREASVTKGQLSSSNTVKFSAAQGDIERCLIPSSVISSQCDNVCNRTLFSFQHLIVIPC